MFYKMIVIISCFVATVAFADQWDDTFNAIITNKSNSLPYSLGEGYEVFDIGYNMKQRTFTHHILASNKQMSQHTIKQAYQKDLPVFCADLSNQASLNSRITYLFLFYRQPTTKPFVNIKINKMTCDSLKRHQNH